MTETPERSIPPADHELKTWPEYYTALERGVKTFEYRRDDRTPAYQVGDVLKLREWNNTFRRCQSSFCRSSGCMFPQACPGDHRVGYTDRECLRRVTYVARGGVIPDGFCIMSVEPLASPSGSPTTPADAVGGLISALEDDIAQGDMPNIRRTLTALKSAHQRSRTGAAR